MPIVLNGSTGITDVDGGTVVSTADIASQAEAQAGTDNTKVMTPLRVAQIAIGVGQAWQSVTGSRALNTNYTNSTGRPIVVCVSWNSGSGFANVTVDGVGILEAATSGNNFDTMTFIVPAGSVYSVRNGSAFSLWTELR